MVREVRLALVLLLSLAGNAAAAADDPLVGFWRPPPEPGGESSLVELYIEDGLLHGRIARSYDAQGREADLACEKCPGALAGTPVRGMRFLENLRRDGERWVDGQVMDVRPGLMQGVIGHCELRLEGDRVVLLGWVGARFLGEESVWQRAAAPPPLPSPPSPPSPPPLLDNTGVH